MVEQNRQLQSMTFDFNVYCFIKNSIWDENEAPIRRTDSLCRRFYSIPADFWNDLWMRIYLTICSIDAIPPLEMDRINLIAQKEKKTKTKNI